MQPEITDQLVWEAVKQICANEETLKQYINQDVKDDTPEITKKLQKIAKKRDTILAWYDNGLITEQKATEKLKTLKNEEQNLKNSLKNAKKPVDYGKIVEQIKKGDVSAEERRNVLLKVVDKITIQRTDTGRKAHELKFHIFFK
jgi:bifunctional N-acetylglucosamine-1-phosphate-uridyltransferase/glucosamine-1-phosphate-acetyltransferase GlmU-like protein